MDRITTTAAVSTAARASAGTTISRSRGASRGVSLSRAVRAILVVAALAFPAAAIAWGTLDDIRYKVKSSDGNLWEHLLGRGNIVRGDERRNAIAFTFDDGPDRRTTPLILDALDAHGVKGAFFINGAKIHGRTAGGPENQAVLRDIYRRGHFIGNHTFDHMDITTLDETGWKTQVLQVEQVVRGIVGRRPHLFRPPFAKSTPQAISRLVAEGYTVVMWNLEPLDWNAKTPDALVVRVDRLLDENPEGGVVVLHDTSPMTAAALPRILERIDERNAERAALGQPTLEIVGIEQFVRRSRP